jgi:hypothetical protein
VIFAEYFAPCSNALQRISQAEKGRNLPFMLALSVVLLWFQSLANIAAFGYCTTRGYWQQALVPNKYDHFQDDITTVPLPVGAEICSAPVALQHMQALLGMLHWV